MTFSAALMAALNSRESGEVPVLLFTCTHDDLADPIYLSTDNADEFVVDGETVRGTTSNGTNYLHLPMSPNLPSDLPDRPSSMQVVFDNIGQSLVEALRSITDPLDVNIKFVLASSPDTVEAEISYFQLVAADFDIHTIVASLSVDHFMRALATTIRRRPANYPGVFA